MKRGWFYSMVFFSFMALFVLLNSNQAQTTVQAQSMASRALATTVNHSATPIGVRSGSSEKSENHGLFVDAGVQRSKDYTDDSTVIRGRFVEIDFDLLADDGFRIGDRIALNPFDETRFTAVLERVESNPSGSYTWIGHLEGIEHSQVTLVVRDELMVGQFSMPTQTGHYEVRYAGDDLHEVVQVNPLAFQPDENDAIPVELPEEDVSVPTGPSVTDDGSVIDLMVVYTDDARQAAGQLIVWPVS